MVKVLIPSKDLRAALDTIPECVTTFAGTWNWFEFSITDPTFAGDNESRDQDPDHVIGNSDNLGPSGEVDREFTYSMVVTHGGATPTGAFDVCRAIQCSCTIMELAKSETME